MYVLSCTHFDPVNPDIQARLKDVKSVQKWDRMAPFAFVPNLW